MPIVILLAFLLSISLCPKPIKAQDRPTKNPIIDSLSALLTTTKAKERVEVLNALAWEWRNIDPARAVGYVDESIILSQKIGYQKGLAYAYRTKSSIHWNRGDYTLAVENALEGLQLFEDINDSLGIANTYLTLGNIYNRQRNIPYSYEYYQKALAIFTPLGEKLRAAACLNNLANLLSSKGEYKQASEYIARSLAINRAIHSPQGKINLAHNLNNLGFLYYKREKLDSALLVMKEFEKVIDEIGYNTSEILIQEAFLTLSFIYLQKKEIKQALEYAQKSLQTSEKIAHKSGMRDAYKQLATIYSARNQINQAYWYQKKYIAMSDSILGEESIAKIAEAQAQYEMNAKERQILNLRNEKIIQDVKIRQQQYLGYFLALFLVFIGVIAFSFYRNHQQQKKINLLLNEKNQAISEQKQELEKMNKTKDKFFSIIAHDLKSPINSLKGFTSMLANYAQEMNPEEIKKIASDLQYAVNHTLELADNLLTWARLQMENVAYKPAVIDLVKVIDEQIMLSLPAAQAKANQLESHISANLKVIADTDHLHFVLRNLINNAIKFTQNGKIELSAEVKDGKVQVAVRDTGVGISPDFIPHIFDVGYKSSTKGTAGEKGTGLGLPLCKEFIEKNGGEIWVESTPNQGSTFFFTLPAS
ncbi:tetratricopeptide repeat-containing sensor histidine kinase [Thermoflexibacter ruber]|uniref:histidine kinase n=1 Tax=Thermoflexibacter ruber TaxID=1003 RepID=A0A1I2IJ22_9BACT|nr:ATP-binding protein [Thermoflexibacter ruber]SFF42352.1 Signal transduction histidine kinase [Thermoflexibacter ruber]